ncbi:MAG TPA: sodium:proton antiporter [Bacillota bacterium]|nr:sodium:proton antiporter [Bacillota bacterium]HQC36533.1 sodium:proton antiporter [Bacillota bacterium]
MMTVNYVAAAILVTLGLYTVSTQKNLIKIVIGLGIADYGINLFIVSVGYNRGGTAPIFNISDIVSNLKLVGGQAFFVDPVPQALTLTSIVIGACVNAMALSLVVKLYQQYHTTNTDEIRRLRG